MTDVIVVGAGGHARVLTSVLRKLRLPVLGYTAPEDQGSLLGANWLGDDSVLDTYDRSRVRLAMGVGLPRLWPGREVIARRLGGFEFLAVVSPQANVDDGVEVGEGSVAFDGVVVQTGTRIGRFAILNTRCSVDHDCSIDDYAHIAPGATLCGEVTVGKGSMVGAGATVTPGCRIGEGIMIGAGAVVTTNCLDAGTYVGVPAKRCK